MEQDEQDVELAQDMGLIIQGAISSSVFYATNSELQKINDTLAAYKDFNDVLKDQATVDQATVDATFEKFKVFLKSIPQYLAQVL
jgi:response regulator of citrate/malate metabolism